MHAEEDERDLLLLVVKRERAQKNCDWGDITVNLSGGVNL